MEKMKPFSWTIRQQANKSLMYLYDDVTKYGDWNWDTWDYDDSETSANHFRDVLAEIPDGTEIELHINSNGGDVFEGTAIYNLLKAKQGRKVGIVDGAAHSVAFLILQALDERVMNLGTSALIHNMWTYASGNANELRKVADDLDAMMQSNRQIFLERAKITEDRLIELMDAGTFLTPNQALEYGLIDKIGNTTANEQMVDSIIEERINTVQTMMRQLNERKRLMEAIQKQEQGVGQEKKSNMKTFFEKMKGDKA